jgi:sulfatase maturation enzyme AslB (radical SAM superfamily)
MEEKMKKEELLLLRVSAYTNPFVWLTAAVAAVGSIFVLFGIWLAHFFRAVVNSFGHSADTINKLHKFKYVEILISIDDIGQRFEIQRGGSWEQVLKNIKSFKEEQSSKFMVRLSPAINIQNLLYLDQLVDFSSLFDLQIVWSYLDTPEFFSINNTTQTTKNLVYKKYANHHNDELRSIAARVINSKPVDGTIFLDYMKKTLTIIRHSYFSLD